MMASVLGLPTGGAEVDDFWGDAMAAFCVCLSCLSTDHKLASVYPSRWRLGIEGKEWNANGWD